MTRSRVNGQGDEAPQAGDNSRLSAETFFKLHRDIQSAIRKKDEAVSKLRTMRKQAAEAGLDMRAYDRVMRLVGFTRPELAEELETIREYAAHLRVPVYSEIESPPSEEADEGRMVSDAEARGLVAGRSGEARDKNPWDLSTPMGQAWDRGHLQGQREIAPRQK